MKTPATETLCPRGWGGADLDTAGAVAAVEFALIAIPSDPAVCAWCIARHALCGEVTCEWFAGLGMNVCKGRLCGGPSKVHAVDAAACNLQRAD